MSQSGLSLLAGVSQPAISKLEKTLITKSPSESLEPWVGKALTLATKDDDCKIDGTSVGNLSIYCSGFCSAVIQHYAFKGNKVAQYALTKFSTSGIDSWIRKQTGWQQSSIHLEIQPTLRPVFPRASVDPVPGEIAPMSERAICNRLVREYVFHQSSAQPLNEQDTWRWQYRELKYRYHYDVYARAKKTGLKKLDQVAADGKLPELLAICNYFLTVQQAA